MDWDDYWKQLVINNKIETIINQMNQLDATKGLGENYTEQICQGIYNDYLNIVPELEQVKKAFLDLTESITPIHSKKARVKGIDSLLIKIIKKRYIVYNNDKSRYTGINKQNYVNIITDLIGVRLILHNREQWRDIHKQVLSLFPLHGPYHDGIPVPHCADQQFLAEEPIKYYAVEDDCSEYKDLLKTIPHEKDYRSIHYVISYKGIYIELQIRTIYDEAWNDVDHAYVYKKEANPNNDSLKWLSMILAKMTNASNDIGDLIQKIYNGRFSVNSQGQHILDSLEAKKIELISKWIQEARLEFEKYCDQRVAFDKFPYE